jgi:hypothetical protein
VKKGRHRRYEEARALKRGPDLDIEAIFDDLESDRPAGSVDDEIERDPGEIERDQASDEIVDDDDVVIDEEERERG